MNPKIFFISHSTDEKQIALSLKKLIKSSDAAAEVFCSSDYESLPKGREPTGEIFKALERATHLLILVSSESERNQWVNFESGFFFALKKNFHVICIGNFSKGAITGPLGILQATSMNDPQDMKQLLVEVGLSNIDEETLKNLELIGQEYPSPRIKVQPYLLDVNDRLNVALLIQNMGAEAKEFTKSILRVPLDIIQKDWGASDTPPSLRWERKRIANTHMVIGTLISTEVSGPPGYPVVPRPDRVIPARGNLDTQEYYLRIPLNKIEDHVGSQIEYEVIVDGKIFKGSEALQDLPFRDSPATLRPGALIKYVPKLDQLPDTMRHRVAWRFHSGVSDDEIALDEFGVEYRLRDPKGDMVAVKKNCC